MAAKKFMGLGCMGIGLVGLLAIAVWGLSYGVTFNNKAIKLNEDISGAWGNVQSAYQRRADLIPNIVETAKGYAEFEAKTLKDVIDARSKATSINVDASDLTEENIAQFQAAQEGVSSGLGRLLATVEAYPDLKANENFKELINELERTENRINVERNKFNATVKPYSLHIKQFPGVIFARLLGFTDKPYFAADAGAQNAPKVDFEGLGE